MMPGTFLLTPRATRFAALAIRHYIAVLRATIEHCGDDETASLANDIGYYEAILADMESAAKPAEVPPRMMPAVPAPPQRTAAIHCP